MLKHAKYLFLSFFYFIFVNEGIDVRFIVLKHETKHTLTKRSS